MPKPNEVLSSVNQPGVNGMKMLCGTVGVRTQHWKSIRRRTKSQEVKTQDERGRQFARERKSAEAKIALT